MNRVLISQPCLQAFPQATQIADIIAGPDDGGKRKADDNPPKVTDHLHC